MQTRRHLIILLLLTLSRLVTLADLPQVRPQRVGLSAERLALADSAIMDAVNRQQIPGAVLAVVRHGKLAWLKAYGNRQVEPSVEPMTTNTIFDMASCSKCMSTAISTLILCEQGRLRLQDPVNLYLPEFEDWKDANGETTTIRIQHLLTHTSGLPAYASVSQLQQQYGSPNPEGLMQHICHMKRLYAPEADFTYSCLNYITLQNIIQHITGQSLRQFAKEHIFRPLGMQHTDYLPTAADAAPWLSLIAPTTVQPDGSVFRGQVHDPLARVMNGGISGNAGLFSCAQDIATFCAMLQNQGSWDGVQILSPQTVLAMRSIPQGFNTFGRTYGWDISSPYASCNGSLLSPQTYGHTGFTGTGIVIDPVNDLSIILLSNAVHPQEGRSSMVRLRSIISNIVASAILPEKI